MNSVTVNRPTRTWLRAIAVVSLLVAFFLATGTASAAPPPVKHPGFSFHLIYSQQGTSSLGSHQPAAVSPASDIYCLAVTLPVTNNAQTHAVYIKVGLNNVSCGAQVTAIIWQYSTLVTCDGSEYEGPSNSGEILLLNQGTFVTAANDNWLILCENGYNIPVPYQIVVTATAEGMITGSRNFAYGEQSFGGTFS